MPDWVLSVKDYVDVSLFGKKGNHKGLLHIFSQERNGQTLNNSCAMVFGYFSKRPLLHLIY